MVGSMTGSWRVPRGSTAFFLVVGLVLLSFLLLGSSPAWYGSDPAHRSADVSADPWTPGAWDTQASDLPQLAAGAREQAPPLWPPSRRSERPEAADPMPATHDGWLDPGTAANPRQTPHRTAGSRSPPPR